MKRIARILCLALAGLLGWTGAMCQKENDVWYFGNGAGVSFVNGTPVGISGGQTNQLEGTAAISDAGGNLLMYTDGQNLWDRNHNVMPNGTGLLSGTSSAMAAVIVPQPCNFSTYYLFVVNDRSSSGMNSPSGLTVSVVDMSLNGGNGDILPNQKNLLLDPVSSEKVVCTRHANGRDVWILHRSGTALKAYLLSPSGLSGAAVVSNLSSYNDLGPGTMKISPDGSLLASCAFNFVELFDFNPATGQFSNPRTISDFLHHGTVDVEFSLNSRYLYWTYGNTFTGSKVSHLDLQAGNTAAILATDSVIATTPGGETLTAMAIGPDGKIYVGDWSLGQVGTDYLSVIAAPNAPAFACNFVRDAVALSPGSYCLSGLNNRTVGRAVCVLATAWTHFAVTSMPQGRLLTWETVPEQGNHAFQVERAMVGGPWETIAEVAAGANAAGTYRYVDPEPLEQGAHYRIARVQEDGTLAYSEVRFARGLPAAAAQLALHPVPCRARLQVTVPGDLPAGARWQVHDHLGRVMPLHRQPGATGIEIDTEKYAPGQYVLTVATTGRMYTALFVVAR